MPSFVEHLLLRFVLESWLLHTSRTKSITLYIAIYTQSYIKTIERVFSSKPMQWMSWSIRLKMISDKSSTFYLRTVWKKLVWTMIKPRKCELLSSLVIGAVADMLIFYPVVKQIKSTLSSVCLIFPASSSPQGVGDQRPWPKSTRFISTTTLSHLSWSRQVHLKYYHVMCNTDRYWTTGELLEINAWIGRLSDGQSKRKRLQRDGLDCKGSWSYCRWRSRWYHDSRVSMQSFVYFEMALIQMCLQYCSALVSYASAFHLFVCSPSRLYQRTSQKQIRLPWVRERIQQSPPPPLLINTYICT